MIQINLLPGAKRKASRLAGRGLALGAMLSGVAARVHDRYLVAAVASATLALAAVGGLAWTQRVDAAEIAERQARASQDSVRYAAVLAERFKAEAQRDSVLRQLTIITAIDNNRFVWPHVMDEVSRALPPYTWLTALEQTSAASSLAAADTASEPVPAGAAAAKRRAAEDSAKAPRALQLRLVGRTVDIQALTRFMKLLEASPFLRAVSLARSGVVLVEGKEVTEFQLDMEYEAPSPALLRTTPMTLTAR